MTGPPPQRPHVPRLRLDKIRRDKEWYNHVRNPLSTDTESYTDSMSERSWHPPRPRNKRSRRHRKQNRPLPLTLAMPKEVDTQVPPVVEHTGTREHTGILAGTRNAGDPPAALLSLPIGRTMEKIPTLEIIPEEDPTMKHQGKQPHFTVYPADIAPVQESYLLCENDDFLRVALTVERFGPPPTRAEEAHQLEHNRTRLLEGSGILEFQPATEGALEAWVDLMAAKIKGARMAMPLFVDLWASKAGLFDASLIHRASGKETHEEVVDQVAKQKFPDSKYYEYLEKWFLEPGRSPTVQEGLQTVAIACGRYVRLCRRHNQTLGLTNRILRVAALKAIPKRIEDRLVWIGAHRTYDSVVCHAQRLAEETAHDDRPPVPLLQIHPAEESEAEEGEYEEEPQYEEEMDVEIPLPEPPVCPRAPLPRQPTSHPTASRDPPTPYPGYKGDH